MRQSFSSSFLHLLLTFGTTLSADSFSHLFIMSAAATSNSNNTSNSISEVDDVNMFQAARRNGRRNALGDLGESLAQGEFSFLFFVFIK